MPLMDIYLKGIEKEKLEHVFHKLIERHESLRSSFLDVDGEAVQKIHNAEEVISNFEIEYYETSEDGMIFSHQEGKEWTKVTGLPFQEVVEHFVRPFDLAEPPLLRVGFIKIWGDTQILMFDMHHIASDGVSMVILIDELWRLYDGEEISPLRVQYKDYAEWVGKEEQKKAVQKLEAFWLDHFKGELPVLDLPTDFQRPQRMSFEGDTVFFEIPKEETDQLNKMSMEQGETLFMILFAAFNVLMARLSGQEEVVVGTVTAGRNHADLQDIVGMFVNTIALRNYPAGDKTFRAFLAEVKDRTIAAFEHEDYPLEQLVSKVASREDRSRNPLFDVVFELENEDDRTEYLLEALMMDPSNPYKFKTNTSKFDLLLVAIETDTGMQFKIEYSTKLYKEETIGRFVNYYSAIISSVCRDPNQKISEIDMVPREEKKKLLYEFNDVESTYPRDKTIHELFEEQVAKTPENVAVVYTDMDSNTHRPITYRALHRKSSQLAHLLRDKGTSTNSIVGIMFHKSVEMIIGIMATLKAGGAYLPLNPDYPNERKKYIIDDCRANILLTNFKEPIDFAPEVIDLDNDIYNNSEPFERDCSKDSLAYIMYTSGSTGKPKGVMIDHRCVVRLVKNTNYQTFREDESILQTGALEFDASTYEIWGCLLNGASFYLVSKDTILNAEKLKKTLNSNNITSIWMTSALFNQMLDTDPDIFCSLKYLLTGGDIVSPSHVRRLKDHVPGITVINCYGPTENTTFSTFHPVEKEYIDNIPIGGPIANSTVYILDKFHRPVPIGTGGELYVGGDGVSRGYLNNPELTSEKFFPDPFFSAPASDENKASMYASGDLARWLPDGNIEFLGRIDFQVKIRGFRIEPGEIDNHMMNIDFISDAAVIARKNPETNHHYLCAYFASPKKVDIGELKEILLQDLPNYMIPSFFTQMDALPLTSNGKVDRRALPEPILEVAEEDYVAPETDTEKYLAEIWAEVLGLKRVGVDDNFFENGGDSIKTILISARLQKKNMVAQVNDFFQYPTIRELASKIQTVDATDQSEEKVAVTIDMEKINRDSKKDYNEYLKLIEIDENENWNNLSDKNNYDHILVTGSTGYLGAYIVQALLINTDATLYLPVRGESQENAADRLMKRLTFYFGNDFLEANRDRLIVLKSDLREDDIGIDKSKFDELAGIVEAVVHPAANVKHFGLYEEFHKDNVEATEMLLDFALNGKKKDFHFVSTMDTGRGDIPGKDYLLFTEYCHDEGQEIDAVYIKSKFEAEKRVLEYRKKGLNTSIHRAANMTFHSDNGRFQENIGDNFFYSMLRLFVKVGFWSQDMIDLEFDLSYVNQAAEAIARILNTKELTNGTYHICSPHTMSWMKMKELLEETGTNITDKTPEEIKYGLSQYEGNTEYETIIERVKAYEWEWTEVSGTLTMPKVDRTVKLLEKLGFEWAVVNKERIEKMIAHCREVSFL